MPALKGVPELEMVKFAEDRDGSVTVQLALREQLAVPMTVERDVFWGWPSDMTRHEWLMRCAQTLLDIYGDARNGCVLSDYEVQQKAAA